MLSGFRSHGVVRELTRAGAIAYRRKGASADALAAALTESIEAHAAERRASARPILAWYCRGLNRRPRRPSPYEEPKASAIRTSSSFFTSSFGSGRSTGKCREPLVLVYPSVSSASAVSTEPLCGR